MERWLNNTETMSACCQVCFENEWNWALRDRVKRAPWMRFSDAYGAKEGVKGARESRSFEGYSRHSDGV